MKYLMGGSPMLSEVSAVKEEDLKIHFPSEQKVLKLISASRHIIHARYNTY